MDNITKIEPNNSEWLPSFLFCALGREVDSRYFFRPEQLSRDDNATFDLKIRLYRKGGARPILLEYHNIGFYSDWSLCANEVFPNYDAVEEEFAYIEFYASSNNLKPDIHNRALPFYGSFSSRDGRLAGYLASNNIWGAPRRVYRERYFCDTLPGVRIDEELNMKVLVANPFVRPCPVRAVLFHADGRQFFSEWKEVGEKSVEVLMLGDCILDGTTGLFGVAIEAETKIAVFYAAVSRKTGQMLGIDHGHPYLLDVLSH